MSRCLLVSPDKKEKPLDAPYPNDIFFMARQYPDTVFNLAAYEDAFQNARRSNDVSANRSSGIWNIQGPGNIGARANTIAVDPKNPLVIYIGFSDGGLFKTTDGGLLWVPIFDDQNKLSIGVVTIDPTNSDVIYVGTGDPNISGYPFIGDGLYKSTNAGKTWKKMGLEATRIISKIIVPKSNPNIIYAATMGLPFAKNEDRGLYKSIDGGNQWQKVLYVNDSTGVIDLVVHPTNPNIVYAATWNRIRNNKRSLVSGPDAKIYKSVDGGTNWTILEGGLPQDRASRIGIGMSMSNPSVMYASYVSSSDLNLKGIYKTKDGGESWESLPVSDTLGISPDIFSGFGWYFGKIVVNPQDENDVFMLSVDAYRSQDGGQNWDLATPIWWTYEVHADKHDLVFDRNSMYLATDGGVYQSDIFNGEWQDIENIPTTQFYRVAHNPNNPTLYYGGAQDNGTTGGNSDLFEEWERLFGGDGFQPLFHPSDPNIFYAETQNGGIVVTIDGGNIFESGSEGIEPYDPKNWDMPLMMSTFDPNILFTGTDKIYKNNTGPQVAWSPISPVLTRPESDYREHNISTLHQSPVNGDYLAAGTSDGLVWVSDDGGQSWDNVSTFLPDRYVTCVHFSPTEPNTLYASFSGYKDNDFTPHIYISIDLGVTWQPIQSNLPSMAINNILVLPSDQNEADRFIFVATDAGVYYSRSRGISWKRLGENMPFVTVYDIDLNPVTNEIVAGTFGRSILTFDLGQIDYPFGVDATKETVLQNTPFVIENKLIQNTLKIHLDRNSNQTKIVIFDLLGKIIYQGLAYDNELIIPTDNWSSGVYFVSTNTNSWQKAQKIIKI